MRYLATLAVSALAVCVLAACRASSAPGAAPPAAAAPRAPGGLVTGTITWPDGHPAADTQVFWYPGGYTPDPARPPAESQIPADGGYSLAGCPCSQLTGYLHVPPPSLAWPADKIPGLLDHPPGPRHLHRDHRPPRRGDQLAGPGHALCPRPVQLRPRPRAAGDPTAHRRTRQPALRADRHRRQLARRRKPHQRPLTPAVQPRTRSIRMPGSGPSALKPDSPNRRRASLAQDGTFRCGPRPRSARPQLSVPNTCPTRAPNSRSSGLCWRGS